MKHTEWIEKVAKGIVKIPMGIFLCVLTIASMVVSVYPKDAYVENVSLVWDNPIWNLLFLIGISFLFFLIGKWVEGNIEKRRRGLLVAEMIFAFVFGLGFSAVSKCFPTADQASVYYGAKHFATNWFEDLAETGSYFSVYPHQMGLALGQEIILRLFHTESYHVLQAVNALGNSLTIWSLFVISDKLFENKKVSVYTMLFTWLFLPLFWYTPFVYGDIPSIGLSLGGFALLLIGMEKSRKRKYIFYCLGILSLLLATMIRKNTLIFVIALFICFMIYAVRTKRIEAAVLGVLALSLCIAVGPLIIRFYESRSGKEINDGMPSICHMMMGLQESETGNGWYNGYNFDTYVNDANYDVTVAKSIAKNDLTKRLAYWKENPIDGFSFFGKKILQEWLSSDYGCYHFTSGAYYERWPIVESLYSGTLFLITRFFMDKYGFVIFLFAFLAILFGKRTDEKKGILNILLLTGVLGGFLFYLMWEASGRYILPYMVMLLMYAALGFTNIEIKIKGFVKKR